MQKYTLTLEVQQIPQVARRGQHVLIAIQDEHGNYILGSKKVYPEHIYRFVGGGIEEGEDPVRAAARELHEETGIDANELELIHLAVVEALVTTPHEAAATHFLTHVFFYKLKGEVLQPSSDVQALQTLSPSEMEQLITLYGELPKIIDSQLGFAWYDYGQLYGYIHKIALTEIEKRHL
jgi:8-oxo-dGTP pyrophosphatase MutT (NUDIX family)